MTNAPSRLDPAFLDRQRRRLKALHAQLLQVRRGQESEQAGVKEDLSAQAREYEDDAQKLTALELQDNLSAADDERLSNIERALMKMEEGTYGLSDGNGQAIAIARLEASPESIYKLQEQESRDQRR